MQISIYLRKAEGGGGRESSASKGFSLAPFFRMTLVDTISCSRYIIGLNSKLADTCGVVRNRSFLDNEDESGGSSNGSLMLVLIALELP